jgi:hypothetical protein
LPVAELHAPSALPKLSLRLRQRHPPRSNIVLQRLCHADQHVHRRVHLTYPVLQHAASAQRSGERDDGTNAQGCQRHHARKFGANPESAEQAHLGL